MNIITDVTITQATVHDNKTLPAIHARLERRNLLPTDHLVDGSYTSVDLRDRTPATIRST